MLDVALWSTKFRLFAVDMIGEAGLSARVRPELEGDAPGLACRAPPSSAHRWADGSRSTTPAEDRRPFARWR
jgi:hypothetical protein